jgi:hypothetical protein
LYQDICIQVVMVFGISNLILDSKTHSIFIFGGKNDQGSINDKDVYELKFEFDTENIKDGNLSQHYHITKDTNIFDSKISHRTIKKKDGSSRSSPLKVTPQKEEHKECLKNKIAIELGIFLLLTVFRV